MFQSTSWLVIQREYEYGSNQHGNGEGKNQPFPCTEW